LEEMRFDVTLVESADDDLSHYRKPERLVILDGIARMLEQDADQESRKRKRLRPNALAPWELRIGDFRVFYEIPEDS